jgi:hypothetical protein
MTAYSVSRRLTRNYTGSLIEVTFLSGITEQTESIGYVQNDVSGTININRLQQIASGATGGNVYISKIYNQYGGTSYDFVQTNMVNMPLIATGGTLITLSGNNRLSIFTENTGQWMSGNTPTISAPQPMTFFMAVGATGNTALASTRPIIANNSANRWIGIRQVSGVARYGIQFSSTTISTLSTPLFPYNKSNSTYTLLSGDGTSAELSMNDSAIGTGTNQGQRFETNSNFLFRFGTALSQGAGLHFQEMIIYSGDQSTNRLSILSGNTYGINTYYGTY